MDVDHPEFDQDWDAAARSETQAERLDRNWSSLLQELRGGPLTVNELVEATGMGQANVSRHLALLHTNGLVARERDGVYVRYQLADKDVLKLCELVCGRLESELSERRKVIAGR